MEIWLLGLINNTDDSNDDVYIIEESVDENDIDINSLKCYKSIYLNKKKPQTELHSTIINCDPKEEIRCFNVKFNYSREYTPCTHRIKKASCDRVMNVHIWTRIILVTYSYGI